MPRKNGYLRLLRHSTYFVLKFGNRGKRLEEENFDSPRIRVQKGGSVGCGWAKGGGGSRIGIGITGYDGNISMYPATKCLIPF